MPQEKKLHKTVTNALVALGSNKNLSKTTRSVTLRTALTLITGESLSVTGLSPFYQTPAFPAGAGPDFVNAAARIETTLAPDELLARLHAAEAELGRERRERWAARVIDIDLLAYGDLVLPDRATFRHWADLPLAEQMTRAPEGLILPHPRMQDRAFVLVPLADVAPDWRHPVLGRTVAEMLADLPAAARAEVRALPAEG